MSDTDTRAYPSSYDGEAQPRMGFFTDTTVCIGCKACEVACKEWNAVPEDGLLLSGESYDNTSELGANSWRHVAFIEQDKPLRVNTEQLGVDADGDGGGDGFRWLMSSDVCNGCGYCVPACPYGVLDRREGDGRVFKCTLCYDRLKGGLEPACAKACPTKSINFGPLEDLRRMADERLEQAQQEGFLGARLYGRDPNDGVGGDGALFLLLDEPEVYGLPPDPVVTTRHLGGMWLAAAVAGSLLAAGVRAAFGGRR